MLVESVQRPSWMRKLEWLKGRVVPEGTYGIMQVRAHHPISDEESVRRAIAEHFAGHRVPVDDTGMYGLDAREIFLRGYNPDSQFVSFGSEIYSMLHTYGSVG